MAGGTLRCGARVGAARESDGGGGGGVLDAALEGAHGPISLSAPLLWLFLFLRVQSSSVWRVGRRPRQAEQGCDVRRQHVRFLRTQNCSDRNGALLMAVPHSQPAQRGTR